MEFEINRGAPDVWVTRWFQLGGSFIFGVLLPFLAGIVITPELLHQDLFLTSALGSFIAIALGDYFFRSLIDFPGIRASYYVLPAFTSTFGTVLAGLLLARLDYSRPLLIAGYLTAVLWHYIVYFVVQRRQRLAFAVVPFGRVDSLFEIPGIRWQVLNTPRVPRHCRAIVADFHHDLTPEWEQFLAESALQGVSVMHYKQLRQSVTGQVQVEHLSENVDGTLIPNGSFLSAKAVADFATAVAALIILLPALVVLAVAIKLDSRGPIFFIQQRVGYRGKPFWMWKFRTMHAAGTTPAAANARESAKTRSDDSRITRIGRFLRKSRIDELPQLLNVIRGEMSWIGPRPEAEVLSQWYQAEIPFYRYRHIVRPGITGWAQVNQGHVAEIADVTNKLSYDFYYISNFSFWLDVLIIVRTIKTMLTGFGAK